MTTEPRPRPLLADDDLDALVESVDADADAGIEAANADEHRLARVFRGWLRDGHVHPLLHAMRRYRGGGDPE